MSFLRIIPQVWGDGARLLYASIKMLLGLETVSGTDSTSTILWTGSEKYADLLAVNSPELPYGRSRPHWMAHGIDESHVYEDHTEPFPSLIVFDVAECEEVAMHAAHAHAGLLAPSHPLFEPDLTPIDGEGAVRVAFRPHEDIFVHAAEAHDAMRTALHFAAGKAQSRYQHSHPAFASPKTPWLTYSSPLAGEMMRCLAKTFQGCRNKILVAPPSRIRLELETCLVLVLAPYVLSDAFKGANGKNKIVPEDLVSMIGEGARWNPHATRDIIQFCEEGLVHDGEDLSRLWAAWRWVLKTYVGILVLRHMRRPKEDIIWA